MKASTPFVNARYSLLSYSSSLVHLSWNYLLVLVVNLILLFLMYYLALHFGKKPPSLLITLGGKLKPPVKIILTFSSTSFCVRYCCILSNTKLIMSNTNLFKAKFGTRGAYTVTAIVFSYVHSVINNLQL